MSGLMVETKGRNNTMETPDVIEEVAKSLAKGQDNCDFSGSLSEAILLLQQINSWLSLLTLDVEEKNKNWQSRGFYTGKGKFILDGKISPKDLQNQIGEFLRVATYSVNWGRD